MLLPCCLLTFPSVGVNRTVSQLATPPGFSGFKAQMVLVMELGPFFQSQGDCMVFPGSSGLPDTPAKLGPAGCSCEGLVSFEKWTDLRFQEFLQLHTCFNFWGAS